MGFFPVGAQTNFSQQRHLEFSHPSHDAWNLYTHPFSFRLRNLGLSTLTLETLRDVDDIDDLVTVATSHPDTHLGRLLPELRDRSRAARHDARSSGASVDRW